MNEDISNEEIQRGIAGAIDADELLKLFEECGININELENSSTEKEEIKNIYEAGIPEQDSNKSNYNAFELFHSNIEIFPKLLDPFLQTVGLASLVGTSDCGKSTFLRQLSLSIVLDLKDFLGFNLNSKNKKVLYVSTEDDPLSVGFSLKKQISHLQNKYKLTNLEGLKNLNVLFDSSNLLIKLTEELEKSKFDLIIIDAFTDVFTGEINANTQVRKFLSAFDKLAKKHQCLILFLHHIGKGKSMNAPSKDSIIGSQGFEAKMRVVLELKPDFKNNNVDLWVLKSNFLDSKFKNQSHTLKLNSDLIFENLGLKKVKIFEKKIENNKLTDKVIQLHKQGLSLRKIEEQLKNTEFKVSKSVAGQIIKKSKK